MLIFPPKSKYSFSSGAYRHTVINFFEILEDPLCRVFALVSIKNLSFSVLAHLPVPSPRIHRLLLLPELGSCIKIFESLNRQSPNCFVRDRLIACRLCTEQLEFAIYLIIQSIK